VAATSQSAPPRSIPVHRILELPPFPAVARKLITLLGKPNFTIPEVSQLIRSDAVFAAEVLRLANSAMLGLRYEVMSIMHAISVLGMDRLQSLVMTVAMRDFLRGGKQLGLLRLCWRHNLATALVAEELAESCWIEKSDAYTGGLLHDLGRLALISAYPTEYAAVLGCWSQPGEGALRCEERALGINHCEAGLVLADKWGLPSAMREVLCTRLIPKTGPFTVPRLVSIACGLAERLGFMLGEPTVGWDMEWLEQELPSEMWLRVAPKAIAMRESIPLKINLFECEFLQG
jgi:HD-like signal output (HDOD) protein